MATILVDYSTIGHARSFTLRLTRQERDGLEVGTHVTISGDAVPDREATVTALSEDHKDAEFTFTD